MKSLLIGVLFVVFSPLLMKMAKSDTGAKAVVVIGIVGMLIIAII